ncbi:molybdopterin-dependent oxidoreductase [Escherichia coli]|nr:molybdopterin-dependent oxidoreductase [Escherichia coli]
MSKNDRMVGISRRTLVKSTAIGSLALAAGGFSLPFTLRSAAAAVQQASEKVIWGACSVNCGSRCALRLHVKDNEVTWVQTDNTGSDEYGNHQVRACLRGRSIRRRINHPDRLNYPMKRVGTRGEGKFERISWDEALDTIASSLKKTVEQYGNEAVYIQYSSGIVGGNMTRSSPSASAVKRLMNCYGGSLNQYGSYSTAQISCAMPYTYGSNDGNSTTDIENSKLVVMFGNNPAETRMSGGGITYLLEKAREKSNAKMIVIDPRYTDTAAGREDEWLPIRPGTDAALVAGIAWVLINENLVDQPFLDKYCVGYDEKTLPADAPKNGHLSRYGSYSTAQISAAMSYMFGANDGNSPDDIANTKLVVMFGNNPAETRMSGGGVTYYVEQARERSNARMIVIDPRYNDTAAGREDEWLPIRPGTDGALACAIAWVLITENMVDQPFLDKYCVGYDEKTLPANAPRNAHYKAYILGEGPDGIAKTPEWAAKITSIPAEKIIQLAREIGSAKPAYICQGWGPQRHSNGEQTSRAIAMLSVLTGNVGINGGNSGVREGSWDLGVEWFPMLENPVKTQISVFTWTDAIDHGTEMTATRDGVRGKEKLDVPIKFLWCYASNTLINQHGDINHTHEVLQDDSKCEMIVGIDHFMTASAKYCDILLPDLMPTEQEDLISHESAGNMGYVILAQPATSAKFERKPIYWMLSEVAKRLGADVYQTFTEGRSQHEWIKYLHAKTKERNPEMPDYEEMKTTGIFKKKCPEEHYVAFRAFREDPQANPLKTPSGKIEIYSERLAKIADTWELKKDEIIHPLPAYTPGFDGWDDPLRKTYPLQLTGFHYKARTHSSYGNIDVLQQACPQEVWINPIDAQARGIRHGDTVRVFNNNGEMLIAAKVTPRILPGVTAIGQGAWLKADMFGDRVDHGGSINILTSHRPSPLAKGNPSHSNLVQIEKV